MASSRFRREKHLLTFGILRLLDDRYVALPRPERTFQLILTNLRIRPLGSMDSMRDSILSLYHNLITGSKDFPLILYKGSFRCRQIVTPFVHLEQEQRENTTSGMMVPTAGSSAPPAILTPVLPEKTELGAPEGRLELDGKTVTRVISPVYRSESSVMTNRWRMSDYRADGQVLTSVLCRFTKESAMCARTPRQRRKRKDTEESSSSSLSPPEKR